MSGIMHEIIAFLLYLNAGIESKNPYQKSPKDKLNEQKYKFI